MNILEKILNVKRQEIQQIEDMEFGEMVGQIRSLKDALSKPGISVIAEIKMKSPSEGEIFPYADPAQIAKDYESAGAAAISVLTDQFFFGGSLDILKSVRDAVSIPVIRKDFIIDQKQISETIHYNGDAFLLIADALDQDSLQQLMNIGKMAGLEFLVEYHAEKHAEYIFALNPEIVGINCRNLKTMATDITYFEKMISVNTNPKDANKWITGELFRLFNEENKLSDSKKISPKDLSEIISLVNTEKITASSGKNILRKLFHSKSSLKTILKDGKYADDSKKVNIKEIVQSVLKENREEVSRFRNGEKKLLGYFIGKIMKVSGGKINHKKIIEVLNEELKKK